MSEYSTPNRKEQGGSSWVVGSGGSLSIESGGTLVIDPGATVTGGLASNTIGNGETLTVESGGTLDIEGQANVASGAELAVKASGNLAVESTGSLDIESGGLLKFAGTDKAAILAASVANQIAGTASGKKVHGAAYTVVADDDTAGTVTIATGVTIAAKIVQVFRANIDVTGDAVISTSAANLTVADGATFVLTTGDVINYFVFGT